MKRWHHGCVAATTYPTPFTEDEYLALEGVAQIKHEFFAGFIVAMAGAEPEHNRVAQNARVELDLALRDGPCFVVGSDQRVLVEASREYFYPDAVVTCVDPIYVEPKPRSLTNPTMIFEVLSPSTESHDRGAKWVAYRTIPTLTDYVLISSARRELEHYQRDADGAWRSVTIRDGACQLSNGIVLELASIYRRVDLTS